MFVRLGFALALSILSGALARADEPKAYACSFAAGMAHAYDKGEFVQEAVSRLAFGITRIDPAAQSADLRTNHGTGPLRLVRAVNATHFLEVVTEGYLNITTVYDKDEASGKYPAVHSRHQAVLGQPIIAQYQGTCEAKD